MSFQHLRFMSHNVAQHGLSVGLPLSPIIRSLICMSNGLSLPAIAMVRREWSPVLGCEGLSRCVSKVIEGIRSPQRPGSAAACRCSLCVSALRLLSALLCSKSIVVLSVLPSAIVSLLLLSAASYLLFSCCCSLSEFMLFSCTARSAVSCSGVRNSPASAMWPNVRTCTLYLCIPYTPTRSAAAFDCQGCPGMQPVTLQKVQYSHTSIYIG